MFANHTAKEPLQIQPLERDLGFGVKLMGLRPQEISQEEVLDLRHLLYSHKVLLLEDIALSAPEFLKFASLFGRVSTFVDPQYHHPEHPEIFVVSNVLREGKRFGMDRVGYYWHSDSSFLAEPLPVTFLYSQEVPSAGGETIFLDMQQAYDSLPQELRREVEQSYARHEGFWRYLISVEDVGLSVLELKDLDERRVPPPIHPLVIRHPASGAKALYLSEGITRRIAGMDESQSNKILNLLWEHIFQSKALYTHRWKKKQILIWDNRSLIHRAYPAEKGQERLMYRIGIHDQPFFGVNI